MSGLRSVLALIVLVLCLGATVPGSAAVVPIGGSSAPVAGQATVAPARHTGGGALPGQWTPATFAADRALSANAAPSPGALCPSGSCSEVETGPQSCPSSGPGCPAILAAARPAMGPPAHRSQPVASDAVRLEGLARSADNPPPRA